MHKILTMLLMAFLMNCAQSKNVQTVATFKGLQVTGVTVSKTGRIFANFPKWRENVPFSVVEVYKDGSYKPYPNQQINSWSIGQEINDSFISVQSVLAHNNKLYILDTANPLFKGVIANPKIYVYDLMTNEKIKTYNIPLSVIKINSYVNDLRVDDKNNKIYITDSGEAGIIIIDTEKEDFTRILNNHLYTKSEVNELTVRGKKWKNTIHSDGIALDEKNNILYIHALTGYTLYGIETSKLKTIDKNPKIQVFSMKTPAPDGMIMDDNGNLYMADLENDKIIYIPKDKKSIKVLLEGEKVRWADTFSINNGYLYYTNSRIDEALGLQDIDNFDFQINKIKLPK